MDLVLFCWIATIVIGSTEFLLWLADLRQAKWLSDVWDPDEVERTIEKSEPRREGFQAPIEGSDQWTVLLFTKVWTDTKKAPIYSTVERYLNPNLEKRGLKNVKVVVRWDPMLGSWTLCSRNAL